VAALGAGAWGWLKSRPTVTAAGEVLDVESVENIDAELAR
jgi:hypothetical protein